MSIETFGGKQPRVPRELHPERHLCTVITFKGARDRDAILDIIDDMEDRDTVLTLGNLRYAANDLRLMVKQIFDYYRQDPQDASLPTRVAQLPEEMGLRNAMQRIIADPNGEPEERVLSFAGATTEREVMRMATYMQEEGIPLPSGKELLPPHMLGDMLRSVFERYRKNPPAEGTSLQTMNGLLIDEIPNALGLRNAVAEAILNNVLNNARRTVR